MVPVDQVSLFPPEDRRRLRFVNGQVVDESDHIYDIRAAIESLPWQTPLPSSGAPHQYVVLRRSIAAAFDVLACAIARSPDSYLAYHRVDQGARPIEWDGPPWAEHGSPWPPGYVVQPNGSHTYHPELDPRRRYQCTGCGRRIFFEPNWPCRRCGTVAPTEMP